ncbi:MAG: methyltransferase domain-containing protein [Pirellulaceae bacterium]
MATAEVTRASAQGQASLYDAAFFDSIDDGSLASARAIVPLVRELVPCQTVVDVGCGRGAWLRGFQEQGAATILGYDGDYVDRSRLLIPSECFRPTDIAQPFSIEGRFDLAVCLEVGEHLPHSRAAGLVRTLTEAAPAVLFSAALPGQGGTHHVNEQWPRFWQKHFARYDFVRLDPIRRQVWRHPAVKWWYQQNVFLFVDRATIDRHPNLLPEQPADDLCLHLVQERVLNQYGSVRGLFKQLVKAVGRAAARVVTGRS